MEPRIIQLKDEEAAALASEMAPAGLLDRVVLMLRTYPHFLLVRGLAPTEERAQAECLAHAISRREPVKPPSGGKPADHVSFTRVEVSEGVQQSGSVTRYSRTNKPLALHTDSSYSGDPHELLIFQMIRADAEGGNSVIAPVEDIISALDPGDVDRLRQPVFPFGRGHQPVLWGGLGSMSIRYYRSQIETALQEGGAALEPEFERSLEALDAVLEQQDKFYVFHVADGDLLLIDNNRAMHGRTGFSGDSQRLMFRYRAHAGCLAPPEASGPPTLRQEALRVPGPSGALADALGDDLNKAYRAARQARHDVARRLTLATLLADAGRRDLALKHLRTAARLAPGDAGVNSALGNLLFQIGDFTPAMAALSQSVAADPVNPEAYATLSALRYNAGDGAGAHAHMIEAARRAPIHGPVSPDPALPNVLRFRAVENSAYSIKWNNTRHAYLKRLRRGHFALNALMEEARFNLYAASIYGDNLLTVRDLPPMDLALNTVSCADLNPDALKAVTRFLKFSGIENVINDPRKVLKTTREQNALRLGELDHVRFPQTELFRNDASPANVVKRLELLGLEFPMLVRAPGTQTGISMIKLEDQKAMVAHLERLPRGAELYAIQYVDMPDHHGLYHKTRCFFIDRRFYPIANLTNDIWQIHSGDRYRVMDKSETAQLEEQRYLNDPEAYLGTPAFSALHAIRDAIDLDFFGIDFTISPDGEVFVFEANAAMRHNFDHAENFPYTRPHLERASAAFQAMLEDRVARAAI
ncbi:MAG: TauD/TfdA family dioxygenase [Alphaproteobacteria bacterium]